MNSKPLLFLRYQTSTYKGLFLEKGFWLLWPSYVYFWDVQGQTTLSCLVYRRYLQRLNAIFSQIGSWWFIKENGAGAPYPPARAEFPKLYPSLQVLEYQFIKNLDINISFSELKYCVICLWQVIISLEVIFSHYGKLEIHILIYFVFLIHVRPAYSYMCWYQLFLIDGLVS